MCKKNKLCLNIYIANQSCAADRNTQIISDFVLYILRVQIWKGSDSHCYRCCLQRSRSVSALIWFVLESIFKKKVYLLSLTLLLLSEFLPWPEGAVCVAGPWHDKPRSPEGEGGFLEVS